jgi:hypothetical protein
VGGSIVAEVLVGLIDADPTSFRKNSQEWRPKKTLSELLVSWIGDETSSASMAVVVHRHSAGLDRRKSDSAEDHFVLFGSVLLKRGFAIDILRLFNSFYFLENQ